MYAFTAFRSFRTKIFNVKTKRSCTGGTLPLKIVTFVSESSIISQREDCASVCVCVILARTRKPGSNPSFLSD